MSSQREELVTTTDEDRAVKIMQRRNRAAGRQPAFVLVDGPEDGEYTVMTLADAIDGGFLYRWEC